MTKRALAHAALAGVLAAACGGRASRGPAISTTPTATTTPTAATTPTDGSARHPPGTGPAERPRPGPAQPVLAGQIPDRLPTRRRVVALTFDAGADAAGARKILAALGRDDAAATFFITGRWAQLYPQWARRIAARYPIGNHTYDHADLLRLPLVGAEREIVTARAAIARATGRPPVPLFRFPYGSSNRSTLALANRLGYTVVGWTVDTLGWEGTTLRQSVRSVVSRALSRMGPGEIILMHVGATPSDHSTLDADALPTIIHAIRARGYRLVTLHALF
jgi:peptidoglycan/xylan/chitin deacetylase (PgdA/CDA1 family)